MGQEIERKFIVNGDEWRERAVGTQFRQGFLSTEPDRTVRVRLAGGKGTLTIKSKSVGPTRAEFEYEIPADDAAQLLDDLCLRPLIEKTRYLWSDGELTWEIDVFEGENTGLIVAELELEREDQAFEKPPWLGKEVTDDPRYFNSNLVNLPFRDW